MALRAGLDALLVAGLLVAAACGGAGSPSPLAPMTPPLRTTTAPTASAMPEATAAPQSTAVIPTTPPIHVDMKNPIPTAMAADLVSLGLDPKNLPPLSKLDPRTLRGVMKLFSKSLGAKCSDCHTEGDFAAQTRRKKIATGMWNEFAAKLNASDGSPLFCDSCHQGRIVALDRTDKKALAKWMDTAFVDGLKSKDGKGMECETCHVGMEMKILSVWAK